LAGGQKENLLTEWHSSCLILILMIAI
jgi:hypothetical protein